MDIPKELSSISPFIKIANEYKTRDVVIYYWTLLHAAKLAMDLAKNSKDSQVYLVSLLDELENVKKQNRENESLKVDVVAQAHIEQQATKLFAFADGKDRNGDFNKNVVKAFYAAGHLFDVLTEFGEPDEFILNNRKYAKWKATYIHSCLKNGEVPVPGPPAREGEDELNSEFSAHGLNKPQPPPRSSPPSGGVSQNTDSQRFGWNDLSNSGSQPSFQAPNAQPPNHVYNAPFSQHPDNFASSSLGQQFTHSGTPYNHLSYLPAVPPSPSVPRTPTESYPARLDSSLSGQNNCGKVSLEDFIEARRLGKMACSALDYEDAKTAIDFLEKALNVLRK